LQSGITVSGKSITGTLKYVDTGSLKDVWGPGYFMALKFTYSGAITDVKVGLDPSVSSGLVSLDEDKNGVFKVTNSMRQKLIVQPTDGTTTRTEEYDLTGLVFEEPAAG
jgi:hypothetical protein